MKKESIYLVLAFFILCAHSLYANKSVRLSSPNGKIKFSLVWDKTIARFYLRIKSERK